MQGFPNQFILWQSVPDMPPKKPRKVPCGIDGRNIDPHDPSGFMSFEEASALAVQHGKYVGFVLTDNDPYFLLDLDDCWDEQNNCWDQWSQRVCSHFQGAAMEISFGRKGLHVMGRCDASRLSNRRHKFANNQGEFYHDKRFVALGHGMQGDMSLDWTDALLAVVPERKSGEVAPESYQGAVPEYTGPEDDQQLIQMMLRTAGSAAQQFGEKATVKQLWEGDVEALSRFYPSPSGDNFDHSSADAALCSHLAFWTGKDFTRIDRLFRMSGLMRDKWTRRSDMSSSDYRFTSVNGAIANCPNVYSVSPAQSEAKVQQQTSMIASGELLTVMEQQEYFKGCVYVVNENKVLTPTGMLLNSAQFNGAYGGKEFLMRADGTKPTDKPFEAFTNNKVQRGSKADTMGFDTNLPYQAMMERFDGSTAVNVYKSVPVRLVAGDIAPFDNLMKKMFPVERDRAILYAYLAAIAQHQGKKFMWAPVIMSEARGNGKSTLINVAQYVVDGIIQGVNDDEARYSHMMSARDIDKQFNSGMYHKTLVVVHEMHSEGTLKDEKAREDYLKELITEATITIEKKGVDSYNARNVTNFLFCSNHLDAVRLDDNERRFAPFYTAQQSFLDMRMAGMTQQYFRELWAWLRADGFAIIGHYLMNYSIPEDLDPTKGATRAPKTSSLDAAVNESRPYSEQAIIEAIMNDEVGFKGGYISSTMMRRMFEEEGIKAPHGKGLTNTMRSLGFTKKFKSSTQIFHEAGRSVIWCNGGILQNQMTAEHYSTAQGYAKTPSM